MWGSFHVTGIGIGLDAGSNGYNFVLCTRALMERLERVKGYHATRACASTLGDFVHFHRGESVPLGRISSGLVLRCRFFLGEDKMYPGDSSFCVHGLQTVCGQTTSGKFISRYGPFGRICANVSGAMGHTIPLGMVHRLGS